MYYKIIFNARLGNTHRRIHSISGRLGNFIFRTYTDGRITAYYKPRHEPISSHPRANFDALSNQLRQISDHLGLYIISINYVEPV